MSHIPLVPTGWFKSQCWDRAFPGHVAPPWHLKHYREFGSQLLAVLFLLGLVPWLPCPLLPFPVPLSHAQWVSYRLGWSVWGHSYHYGSLGGLGYYQHCIPSHSLSPGAARGTRGVVALPSLGQGSHEFGNLLPQFCTPFPQVSCYHGPSPYLI